MELARDLSGLWLPAVQFSGDLAGHNTPLDHRVIFAQLIQEYYDRGQFIETSLAANSSKGAHVVLHGDPRFPAKLKKAKQTADVIRGMERDGTLAQEPMRLPNRHTGWRWVVARDPMQPFTPAAPSAPSAPSGNLARPAHKPPQGRAVCAGVYRGNTARAALGAPWPHWPPA